MPDAEIASLTEDTTPDSTDNVYVQDAAGAVDKRVPLSALTTITTTATTVNAAGAVMESDYDANTILAATSDNTPVALTVAEQTLVGRITSGAIDDLSATAVRTLLNVEDGAAADQTAAEVSADSTTLVGVGTTVQAVLEELDNGIADHLADTSAAHAASAVSADSTTLVGTGTDVQAVLEELDNGIADHLADTSAAHAASAVSADSTTLVGTGTDVQAVLEELDNGIADHLADTSAAHAASAISADSTTLTGTGTTVQAVLEELDNTVDLAQPKATFPVCIGVALSDETTQITTGTTKVAIHAPYAFTLTAVRAGLTTAATAGGNAATVIDINEGAGTGTTLLSTKLSIDQDEETSTTANSAAVISDASIADAARITFDVDTAGTGAKGLKVWLLGTRSV